MVFVDVDAHLKPSLAQPVNESAYRILRAMPENQIVIADLLARLQRDISILIRQYTSIWEIGLYRRWYSRHPEWLRYKTAPATRCSSQKNLFCQYATPTNSLSTKAFSHASSTNTTSSSANPTSPPECTSMMRFDPFCRSENGGSSSCTKPDTPVRQRKMYYRSSQNQ